ncbi:MAG: cytochrome c biogenesis protein CcdA [bacterium]|nr:cytochrome c biogenesis protein CcdA [bacterium]
MIGQYLEAFILGNQAILTNICLLPLYPGLVAFLAGNSSGSQPKPGTRWLGLLVLAGILTMMLIVGYLLFAFNQSFGNVLPILLPIIYGVVLVMGVLMLLGYNPFARLSSMQVPIFRNRSLTAYLYGLLLGPMTLPCTGPLITSAFLLGANNVAALADGLLYFLFFGLGFGWVLVVLPFLAGALQRRFTRWITTHYKPLTRFSGVLLIFIAVLGILTEVLPNIA